MALSETVLTSLIEAEACLRNALAYSARCERPIVCQQISRMINDIENIKSFDVILDRLDTAIKE